MTTVLAIIDILALIVVPIIAVWVGQALQNRAAKRKDKMAIFQCLMTHRATGWVNPETVNALNSIDIIFYDDDTVRKCWADLLSKYSPNVLAQDRNTAQCKLLEAMAKSLGYGKKITWETIQNPYLPEGIIQRMANAAKFENGQLAMAEFMMSMAGNPTLVGNAMQQQAAKREDKNNAHT